MTGGCKPVEICESARNCEYDSILSSGSDFVKFSCLQCDIDFITQSEWKQHLSTHIYDKNVDFTFKKELAQPDELNENLCEIVMSDDSSNSSESVQCGNTYLAQIPQLKKIDKHIVIVVNPVNNTIQSTDSNFVKPAPQNISTCKFICDICKACFTSKLVLTEYQNNKHSVCAECETYFENGNFLNKEKPFDCRKCRKKFSTKSAWYSHMKIHAKEKTHICDECGKCFAFKQYLIVHQKTMHSEEKHFECVQCGKIFAIASSLASHFITHSTEKPFLCMKCGNSYQTKAMLRAHMVQHTGDKSYKCDDCGKGFTRGTLLAVHKRTHSGIKPYKCPECEKCFIDQSRRRRHLLTHTGEKPHACTECPKRFTQKGSLNEHMLSHTGNKPFKCEDCEKSYTRHRNFLTHVESHARKKQKIKEQLKEIFS